VADAGAAVVGDPVDWAGCGVFEDLGEGFEDGEADLAFVGGGWARGETVAWEFGNEEGGVWFPGVQDLGLVVSRFLRVPMRWVSVWEVRCLTGRSDWNSRGAT